MFVTTHTTTIDYDTKDDEAEDADDLDDSEDELYFSIPSNSKELDEEQNREENRNPDANVIMMPIINRLAQPCQQRLVRL